MLFNSFAFLYIFLPITYLVFWHLRGKTPRHLWLALSGYAFYSFWNYKFCALMLLSTVVSYLAGLGLLRWQDPVLRRLCLAIPVAADLALLGFFKYANFAVRNINEVSSWLGARSALSLLDIVLPVGISFYTFHTITYIVDAYRRVITPTRDFAKFAAYVSFFPQLVAGPIVRFQQIERDFETVDRADRTADVNLAWSFFVLGMVKKVLIADTIGAVIDPALARYAELSTLSAWLCVLGFTYQVYFDFSGYSDMAVGLGHLFGFRLPQNFNSPYQATDVAEFWRRWHVSLTSFLRDYVYLPLGGSRGSRLMTARNVIITMVLCGLWHGANWTYVVWGLYTGFVVALHQVISETWARLPLWTRRVGTFGHFVVGLAIFRSTGLDMALSLLGAMFAWRGGTGIVGMKVLAVALCVAAASAHWGPNTFEMRHRWSPAWVSGLAALFGACLFVLYGSRPAPYVYFQF